MSSYLNHGIRDTRCVSRMLDTKNVHSYRAIVFVMSTKEKSRLHHLQRKWLISCANWSVIGIANGNGNNGSPWVMLHFQVLVDSIYWPHMTPCRNVAKSSHLVTNVMTGTHTHTRAHTHTHTHTHIEKASDWVKNIIVKYCFSKVWWTNWRILIGFRGSGSNSLRWLTQN